MLTLDLDRCTHEDFLEILSDLEDFWGTDRARPVHHPMFMHEFGDTAWVLREDGRVIAYRAKVKVSFKYEGGD